MRSAASASAKVSAHCRSPSVSVPRSGALECIEELACFRREHPTAAKAIDLNLGSRRPDPGGILRRESPQFYGNLTPRLIHGSLLCPQGSVGAEAPGGCMEFGLALKRGYIAVKRQLPFLWGS